MLVDVQHKLQAEGRDLTSVAAAFDSDGDGLLLPTEMEDLLIAIGLENMLQQDAERQAVYLFLDQYAVDASGRINYARFMDETAPVHEGWLDEPDAAPQDDGGRGEQSFSFQHGGGLTDTDEGEGAGDDFPPLPAARASSGGGGAREFTGVPGLAAATESSNFGAPQAERSSAAEALGAVQGQLAQLAAEAAAARRSHEEEMLTIRELVATMAGSTTSTQPAARVEVDDRLATIMQTVQGLAKQINEQKEQQRKELAEGHAALLQVVGSVTATAHSNERPGVGAELAAGLHIIKQQLATLKQRQETLSRQHVQEVAPAPAPLPPVASQRAQKAPVHPVASRGDGDGDATSASQEMTGWFPRAVDAPMAPRPPWLGGTAADVHLAAGQMFDRFASASPDGQGRALDKQGFLQLLQEMQAQACLEHVHAQHNHLGRGAAIASVAAHSEARHFLLPGSDAGALPTDTQLDFEIDGIRNTLNHALVGASNGNFGNSSAVAQLSTKLTELEQLREARWRQQLMLQTSMPLQNGLAHFRTMADDAPLMPDRTWLTPPPLPLGVPLGGVYAHY